MSSNPLDHFPVGKPPPGTVPNFINPPSKGDALVALDGIFVSFMLVAVLIRIYVRVRLVKVWGWDDCEYTSKNLPENVNSLAIADLCFLLIDACILAAVRFGAALHHSSNLY
jgi:hypothetical protein